MLTLFYSLPILLGHDFCAFAAYTFDDAGSAQFNGGIIVRSVGEITIGDEAFLSAGLARSGRTRFTGGITISSSEGRVIAGNSFCDTLGGGYSASAVVDGGIKIEGVTPTILNSYLWLALASDECDHHSFFLAKPLGIGELGISLGSYSFYHAVIGDGGNGGARFNGGIQVHKKKAERHSSPPIKQFID